MDRRRSAWPNRLAGAAVTAALIAVALFAAGIWTNRSVPPPQIRRLEMSLPRLAATEALNLSPDGSQLVFIAAGADGVPAVLVARRRGDRLRREGRAPSGERGGRPAAGRCRCAGTTPGRSLGPGRHHGGRHLSDVGDARHPPCAGGGRHPRAVRRPGAGPAGTRLSQAPARRPSIPFRCVDASRREARHLYGFDRRSDGTLPRAESDLPRRAGGSLPALHAGEHALRGSVRRARCEDRGHPIVVAEHLASSGVGTVTVAVGGTSTMVYAEAGAPEVRQLVWVDRHGTRLGVVDTAAVARAFDISGDGALVVIERPEGEKRSVWMLDRARGFTTRVEGDPNDAPMSRPLLSADGRWLTYLSQRDGRTFLFEQAVYGGARRVRIPWEKCSKRLAAATTQQRLDAELSPGG